MIVTFSGSSDDLVEVDGCPGADEFTVYGLANGGALVYWKGDLVGPDNRGLRVYAIYDGCWHFSVGPISEDDPLPDWAVTVGQAENGYSSLLTIDSSVDVELRLENVEP